MSIAMKTVAMLMLAASAIEGLALAQPHKHGQHGHHHGHKRSAVPDVVEYVSVPGPTVILYEYNGQSITEHDVCEGIANGTLNWASGTFDPPDCNAYSASAAAAAVATPTESKVEVTVSVVSTSFVSVASSTIAQISTNSPTEVFTSASHVAVPASTSTEAPAAAAAQMSPTFNTNSLTGFNLEIASNPNVTAEFQDGVLDCGTFPSAFGAIPVNWQDLGGWSGIQYAKLSGGYVTHIDTAIAGDTCHNKNDGTVTYCSYACPPGYQKSQWPSTQGSPSMAVSVGGLMCGTDNKLYLTNPDLSKNICMSGVGNVFVQNKLSIDNSCICRTDYPGTEAETVPLNVQTSQSSPLTCPDASAYYKHLGMATSAEYYVNMKGVAVNNACTWGSDGTSEGNWAPVVFGVGKDTYGSTWLSIQTTVQNNPSSYKDLDYTVELQGNFGGSQCFYTKGRYCTRGTPANYDPADCQTTSSNEVPGCTVELMSGHATYVLTD